MNKKNSGFSLVELIVVIAIMAVLVGVLAPAYLKYVEKSRKSADVDTIDVFVGAADKVVADEDYIDLVDEKDTFEISFDGKGTGTIKFTAVASGSTKKTGEDAWMELANVKSKTFKLKSKAYKSESGKITGTVNTNGGVDWTNTLVKIDDSSFLNKIGGSKK